MDDVEYVFHLRILTCQIYYYQQKKYCDDEVGQKLRIVILKLAEKGNPLSVMYSSASLLAMMTMSGFFSLIQHEKCSLRELRMRSVKNASITSRKTCNFQCN